MFRTFLHLQLDKEDQLDRSDISGNFEAKYSRKETFGILSTGRYRLRRRYYISNLKCQKRSKGKLDSEKIPQGTKIAFLMQLA